MSVTYPLTSGQVALALDHHYAVDIAEPRSEIRSKAVNEKPPREQVTIHQSHRLAVTANFRPAPDPIRRSDFNTRMALGWINSMIRPEPPFIDHNGLIPKPDFGHPIVASPRGMSVNWQAMTVNYRRRIPATYGTVTEREFGE
jgi:hypothetical protein